MRTPTPHAMAYEWHRLALAAKVLGIEIEMTDTPECGWFQRKLTRGGVMVPARIFLDAETDPVTGELLGDETMACEVNGNFVDPGEAWSYLAGNPITKEEFEYLTARRNHAAWHEPDSPFANPRRPVDWLTVGIPEFPATQERDL